MQEIKKIKFASTDLLYYEPLQQPYQQDIIPGVYQGGFKIWECTLDLLKFMEGSQFSVKNKKIIDLGCGHGLLGISALKSGSNFCLFHDYNKEVLDKITLPNLTLNQIDKYSFDLKFGDWMDLSPLQQSQKFDILLASQVIYKEENYPKVIEVCRKMLKEEGFAILANKHYYFGVGGNMEGFKESIEENGIHWESLEKIVPLKGGNKKEIIVLKKGTPTTMCQ